MLQKQLRNGNFYWLVALVMMGILFYSSSQPYEEQSLIPLLEKWLASKPLESRLSGIAFTYGGKEVSVAYSGYFAFVEFFIRKGAHFFTYFIMSWSLFVGTSKKMSEYFFVAVLVWLAATGYAALDEYHQMLTSGRSPLFQDILLDSVGALTAVLGTLLWLQLFKGKGKKRKKR
ncbi:VanZ family protein [Enterococcus sp. PF1-24]|uniref:VanZ family protein n=1 Tax=unclassified Enterococcus TaxID=2608891 RepID=UPI0024739893|nr:MULTISPECIES: VanZ family protein [unclassified Enterococcus]MDH6363928.1 VanZ family protein [Enterococcus sp. PFB1-1]MDH6401029.1 VanZ family protein [Enterococcus sp. PF1-24]